MDQIQMNENGPAPKTAAVRIVRHLDHIFALKSEGYRDSEIAEYLQIKRNTFHYALKKAIKMKEDNSDLPTSDRISFGTMTQIKHSLRSDPTEKVGSNDQIVESNSKQEEVMGAVGSDEKNDHVAISTSEHSDHAYSSTHIRDDIPTTLDSSTSDGNEYDNGKGEEATPISDAGADPQEPEDWVSQIMRTAKPSRHANKFNLELKYK